MRPIGVIASTPVEGNGSRIDPAAEGTPITALAQ